MLTDYSYGEYLQNFKPTISGSSFERYVSGTVEPIKARKVRQDDHNLIQKN